MCSVWRWKSRWVLTRWVCTKYVGSYPIPHPIPHPEEECDPLDVWEYMLQDPNFHLGVYCVFVVWMIRDYEDRKAFFYWKQLHKINGDRIPSLTRLLWSWGWQSLKRILIQRVQAR